MPHTDRSNGICERNKTETVGNKSDTVVRVNLLYPTMKCSNTSFLQKTQHFPLIFQVDWLQTDRVQQIGN